ncbi:MAG: hypoxanthine phosphoribosyltransferase [Deltaproteobacteria bacterium]
MESHLKQLFPAEEIHIAVNRLAAEIRRDYAGKTPILIGILKGSFIFLADLIRTLKMPLEIDFIRAASYGAIDVSSGAVRITKDIDAGIENRDIIVVEDIVDTGLTLDVILKHLRAKKPASLKTCALIDKPHRRQMSIKIDYLGFYAKDVFLVGYGLDYNEKYRYLPGVYVMEKA